MIVSVKLDANKIKEHLAAENATTRSSRRRRNEKQRERSNQDREESGRAGGGKMHPVKMPPPMAHRMPLCSVSHPRRLGRQAEQLGHVQGHTPSVQMPSCPVAKREPGASLADMTETKEVAEGMQWSEIK